MRNRTKRSKHFLVTAMASMLALTLGGGQVHAQVYKWTDANGMTHYGDRPPAGFKRAEVKTRDSSSSGANGIKPAGPAAQDSRADADAAFRRRQAARDEVSEREKQAAVARCDELRAKLSRQTAPGPHLELLDQDGKSATDSQIAASNARLRGDIERQCGRV